MNPAHSFVLEQVEKHSPYPPVPTYIELYEMKVFSMPQRITYSTFALSVKCVPLPAGHGGGVPLAFVEEEVGEEELDVGEADRMDDILDDDDEEADTDVADECLV